MRGCSRRRLLFGEGANVDNQVPDLRVGGAAFGLGRHLALAAANDVEQFPSSLPARALGSVQSSRVSSMLVARSVLPFPLSPWHMEQSIW